VSDELWRPVWFVLTEGPLLRTERNYQKYESNKRRVCLPAEFATRACLLNADKPSGIEGALCVTAWSVRAVKYTLNRVVLQNVTKGTDCVARMKQRRNPFSRRSFGCHKQWRKENTGRFIMYSGITEIYYRKTVGHLFTKLVQIEGTTQIFFFSVSCFSS